MLSRYIVAGRLDPPFQPTKTRPYILSRMVDIDGLRAIGSKRIVSDTFTMSHDVEFFAISLKADIITSADYWSLMVDGRLIINHVYCKDYGEGLYFQVAHPVKGGKEFEFEFSTEGDERKRIEVSYHFLTDPDFNLSLNGTVDPSYYLDPLPESIEPINLLVENDPCVAPVVWNPHISVKSAEGWCKSIGITADFSNQLDAANYITEALTFLLNHCCGFGRMLAENQMQILIKKINGANGYFDPAKEQIVINKQYNFKDADKVAEIEYEVRQKSSPHKLRTFIHEVGHWLHFHSIGKEQFLRYSSLDPDHYGNRTILAQADEIYIANHLSQYATKWFPIEFIPEVYTARVTGIDIDPKIWEWYLQYGGYECSN